MAVPIRVSAGRIAVGSFVRVRDDDGELALEVVLPEDAEAAAGRISTESPLGRALLDRQAGDRVRFRAPGGVHSVTVVEVDG